MTDITIRMATDDDAWPADLIARSFDHLAANHHLVPDEDQRVPVMREYFLLLSEHAAQGAGEVLVTEDAVAVWFDNTTETNELDDQGVAAYLEGTNHNNQRPYRGHGYADMDPSTMLLSDGTPFYRMWSPAAH